jgi:hypothetical protein
MDSPKPKKLSLKKETLRNLLEHELAQANGGYACGASRVSATCSSNTWDKCKPCYYQPVSLDTNC